MKKFNILGSIENVILGRTHQTLVEDDISKYFLGLGGALKENKFFGEAIVIDKKLYYTYVDEKEKLVTESVSSSFKTPFLITLKVDQANSGIFHHLENTKEFDLIHFYEEISKLYPLGFCFIAEVFFKVFEAAYVKKPPIFNENVLTNANKYWSDTEKKQNQKAIIVGIVVSEQAKKNLSSDTLNKIFYQNPNDKTKSSILAHSHAAIIDKKDNQLLCTTKEKIFQDIDKMKIFGVRHLLNQSVLEKGNFLIFDILNLSEKNN